MNNMVGKEKSHVCETKAQKLSSSIGNFIRYWGFRKIHGAIWTQLYLSEIPLSCVELTRRLKVSKALISPALEELCKFRLIEEGPSHNNKIRVYRALDEIDEVVRAVLESREKKMLKKIQADFELFVGSKPDSRSFNKSRIRNLENMIVSANMVLDLMLSQKVLPSFFEQESK